VIIVGSERLEQWLLRSGLAISAVLLIRFAIDFSARMRWWLAAPFCLLVAAALLVGFTNVFGTKGAQSARGRLALAQTILLAAIPLGFIASSLDCTGLNVEGCSPFCTFIKVVWTPLLAVVCLSYFFMRKGWSLTVILAISFVPLVPHCICYNVGNQWWIQRIGVSPLCYGWGFFISIIAVAALRSGVHLWLSLAVCIAIISGATGFFISHHYYHFPW
jgi:hypothetical protein